MISDELTLNTELLKHSKGIFVGLTDGSARRERARHIIKEFALEKLLLGKHTIAYWFKRCYGQEL